MVLAAEQLEQAAGAASNGSAKEQDVLVPRVCIEAFCVTPEFANAMKTAAQDRRMAKTKTSVGMGGAASAAKRYANVGTPNLIVVETRAAGFAVFQELESLAAVCDEDTKVIVAGPSNDVTLYRELIRQGVCEYLVTPSAPLQIIEAISAAYEDPAAGPVGRSIAVYGVRGGVGSSVLCHNLAEMIAAQSERETILIDLDLEFGTVALDFNVDSNNSVADALADVDALDDVKLKRLLFRQSEHLQLLTSPATIQRRAEAGEEAVLGLLDVTRMSADFVLVDTPRQWTPSTRCTLRQADRVVLVATPDLISLRNMKSVYDWLKAERQHDEAPKLVLNMVGEPKRPEISQTEFSDIVGAPVDVVLPYEPAVFGAALNDGRTLANLSAARKLVEQLEPLAASLAGMENKVASKPKGLGAWLGFGG